MVLLFKGIISSTPVQISFHKKCQLEAKNKIKENFSFRLSEDSMKL